MSSSEKIRRSLAVMAVCIISGWLISLIPIADINLPWQKLVVKDIPPGSALESLDKLPVKGRAPKTDYARSQFGAGWESSLGCSTREIILQRDLTNIRFNSDECQVESGRLDDPYTGTVINFIRGSGSSSLVQIDHVVALSNAWQTGAQSISYNQRVDLANDPLNLLAVDGSANQNKSDGDAATWLPANKGFRCQYVARQIAVKYKYSLWVTAPEKQAMQRILVNCPDQKTPVEH